MKSIYILLLVIVTVSCQREAKNDLGLGYNKTLIIPPINDLPLPGSKEDNNILSKNNNAIIESILNQTQAKNVDTAIIDKIDADSGYDTDENLFQKLFKGKSKR
jgi:hypothetical protein